MRTCACFLTCLLAPTFLTAQEGEIKQIGSWYYQETLDPITDANSSTALTQDEGWTFGITCLRGNYFVLLRTGDPMIRLQILGETWNSSMTWRVDRNQPVIERWRTEENGLGLGGGGAAVAGSLDSRANRPRGDPERARSIRSRTAVYGSC